MTKRVWVKSASGLWSSFDPVIRRQMERKAAKEAKDMKKVGAEEVQATGDIITGTGDG
jgi:hypothetical protein